MESISADQMLPLCQRLAETMGVLLAIRRTESGAPDEEEPSPPSPQRELGARSKTPKVPRNIADLELFVDDKAQEIRRFEQVNVFIHVEVIRMGEVNTKSQRFESELKIISHWLEPQLDRNQATYADQPPSTDWDFWDPQIFVKNAVEGSVEKTTYAVLFDQQSTAMVEEVRYVRGFFSYQLELHDYPFDVQDLELQLSSRRPLREIVFKADPVFKSVMSMSRFTGHQEWKLTDRIKVIPSSIVDSDIIKKTQDVRPLVSVLFKVKRHSWYFVWNVIVFIILFSALAFSTFAIDCTLLVARLPLTFILLLSNVTFKFAVSKTLPKIAYLTFMDKYVLTSLVIMVILSLWHTTVATLWSYLKNSYKKRDFIRIDYVAMGVLCVMYVVFNSTFIAKIKYTVRRAKKHKEKLAKLYQEHIRKNATRI